MTRDVELRLRPPVRLKPGQEWWVSTPHDLAARIRRDRSVVELKRWELRPGLHGSLVRRVRPRTPEWVRPAAILSGLTLILLAGLMLLVEAIKALILIWPLLAAFALAWAWGRITTGHRPVCAGLHCSGCRR